MTATATPVDNGVNVDALLGARQALTDTPEAARFQWRASCRWVRGTHSESTVKGFFGLGSEQSHRTEFSFEADHPEIFASDDRGATPVEYVHEYFRMIGREYFRMIGFEAELGNIRVR